MCWLPGERCFSSESATILAAAAKITAATLLGPGPPLSPRPQFPWARRTLALRVQQCFLVQLVHPLRHGRGGAADRAS